MPRPMAEEKAGKRGRKPKDASGKTQEELAREAGVSLPTWKKWQRDLELGGADLADRKKRAEIQRIETATAKEQRFLAILDEEYVPRAELETALAQVAGVCDQFDAAVLSELPSLLSGLTPARIEKELQPFIDEWKELRANSRSDVWKKARAAVEKELRGDLKKAAAKRK